MANENQVPNPVLPLPPLEYDVQYMNQLIRLLNFYIQQQSVPGLVQGTTTTLTAVPTSAAGLVSGQIWRDTGTNILHIVP